MVPEGLKDAQLGPPKRTRTSRLVIDPRDSRVATTLGCSNVVPLGPLSDRQRKSLQKGMCCYTNRSPRVAVLQDAATNVRGGARQAVSGLAPPR
jgi:hypothetical protein